jgi:cell division protein FtsL
MTGLQEAFYIIAIVFMAVMFILIIALVASVLVIRSKVNKIQRTIEEKVHTVTTIAEKTGQVAALASGGVVRGARRALLKK